MKINHFINDLKYIIHLKFINNLKSINYLKINLISLLTSNIKWVSL
jgi:hypothetical protein